MSPRLSNSIGACGRIGDCWAHRLRAFVGAVAIVMTVAGCGFIEPSTSAGARVPLPAGTFPSSVSKMVCAREAQIEIASGLGVKGTVDTPTWSGHVYSCRYAYPDGAFTLSVKELSSWAQTFAYVRGLKSSLGDTATIPPDLGQGGFVTKDGSVVVRKDWKVLLVDISGVPSKFGEPPMPPGNVAAVVADTILGCWKGD
jgi:hypothetical protein